MKTIQLSERELSIVYSLMAPPYRAEDIRSDEFNELRNKVFYALRDAQNDEPVSNRDELPEDVSTVLAEAYQVVGVMAEALGVFNDTAVQKVMDNLSQQKLVHADVLPFSLPAAPEQQNVQQNIPENIPATQFKPVADLYGLTSPTGSETSFTFDSGEARGFIDGGWSCQEYVELERFQEAVSGNSPVIPDCWCHTCRPVKMNDMRFVVCPDCGNKRCPRANDHRNDCSGSNEPGQAGSTYPAAPQQEVQGE